MIKSLLSVLAAMAAAVPVCADLVVGSLKPAGGESFPLEATISIEWVASVAGDGRYDIYYSKDGGATFPVELVGPWQGSKVDNAKNIYPWKVPAALASNQMRIRICQLSGGHCVQPGKFMMDSPANFSISASTGLSRNGAAVESGPGLDFISGQGNLSVSFSLPEAGKASLKAFDVSGNLVATVADGRLDAGTHRFEVPADPDATQGALVFKLEVEGREAVTRIWNGR